MTKARSRTNKRLRSCKFGIINKALSNLKEAKTLSIVTEETVEPKSIRVNIGEKERRIICPRTLEPSKVTKEFNFMVRIY